MVLQGRGGWEQVRVCHPSCSSLTQRQGVGLKKPEADPRVGGEVGPCPGSGAGQGTLLLQAQGLLPFPQVGTEGHLLSSRSPARLLSPADTAVYGSLPVQKAQGKRHVLPFPPESTSGAATDTQPS